MKVEKLKDPENMTTAVDDFFLTITEKLDIHHVKKPIGIISGLL
jgi:hypothetical protein